jgi:hypothetical protein
MAAREGEKISLGIRVWVYLYAWFVGSHGLAGVGLPGGHLIGIQCLVCQSLTNNPKLVVSRWATLFFVSCSC